MDRLDKQTFIQRKVVENRGDSNGTKIFWSRHAIVEMVNDGLARTEVEEVLGRYRYHRSAIKHPAAAGSQFE